MYRQHYVQTMEQKGAVDISSAEIADKIAPSTIAGNIARSQQTSNFLMLQEHSFASMVILYPKVYRKLYSF